MSNELTAAVDWENMPHDLALVKIENDSIMSMAAAKKRDHEQIKKELMAQLKAYPEFACQAIYHKPVGRAFNPETKRYDGPQQFATGLSIRAAEALADLYGFNRVSIRQQSNGDTVTITASMTDYCTGRVWEDSAIVSRHYKSRDGKMIRHPEDRFLNVICKAAKSRVIREAITRMVPPGLRAELEKCVEKQEGKFLDEDGQRKAIHFFASKNIREDQLVAICGPKSQWRRGTLNGIRNALENGETTVAELIGTEAAPQSDSKPTTTTDAPIDDSPTLSALAEPEGEAIEREETTIEPGKPEGSADPDLCISFANFLEQCSSATGVTRRLNSLISEAKPNEPTIEQLRRAADNRKNELKEAKAKAKAKEAEPADVPEQPLKKWEAPAEPEAEAEPTWEEVAASEIEKLKQIEDEQSQADIADALYERLAEGLSIADAKRLEKMIEKAVVGG